MKVLLRNTETGLFYAGPDKWTPSYSEALDFQDTSLAIDVVCEAKLKAMEVLMQFDNPFFEIPMRIAGVGG
ncbi:MAG TPA: hypothetical protein VNT26_19085 [Candidatus Sulfotelmatobacter sp.]|nr:hypothetical protein [Candidatus Sulfotelmatobacter sp.]HWI59476.1 hypothetical protein [Bacillota bacterium]